MEKQEGATLINICKENRDTCPSARFYPNPLKPKEGIITCIFKGACIYLKRIEDPYEFIPE